MTIVYTDGSCAAPGEPGGWAWVRDGRSGFDLAMVGHDPSTTNQRMELIAAWQAVEHFREGELTIVSDSAYVVNCFNDRWYEKWMANGFRNGKKKPVANTDSWVPFIDAVLSRPIQPEFVHVRGHKGILGNEIADTLAKAGRTERWNRTLSHRDLNVVRRYGKRFDPREFDAASR